MNTNELLKQVRHIEIKAKGLSNNLFAGQYHSAFKGKGLMFSEVRQYQYGDDIRDIDWNVSARQGSLFVKVLEEERELTSMLVIDVSNSLFFGSQTFFKRDYVIQIAATLAFSAISNNDKVGVILFSDKIEKFIPPKKGRKHILFIIRELLDFSPENKETNIDVALQFLNNAIKRRCTAFIISDFICMQEYKQTLTISNRKHDIIGIQVYDKLETALPAVGLMKIEDAETKTVQWIDTDSASVRKQYSRWWKQRQEDMHNNFQRSGVDYISIATTDDFVKSLSRLFALRS